jgi:hypothetical protein
MLSLLALSPLCHSEKESIADMDNVGGSHTHLDHRRTRSAMSVEGSLDANCAFPVTAKRRAMWSLINQPID